MNGFFEEYSSDQITYNGKPVESFGISTGDSLTTVIEKVLTTLGTAVETVNQSAEVTASSVKTDSTVYSIKNFSTASVSVKARTVKYVVTQKSTSSDITYNLTEIVNNVPSGFTVSSKEVNVLDKNGDILGSFTDKVGGLTVEDLPVTLNTKVIMDSALGQVILNQVFAVTSDLGSGTYRMNATVTDNTNLTPVELTQEDYNKLVADKIAALEVSIDSLQNVDENGTTVVLQDKLAQMSLELNSLKDSVNQPVTVTYKNAKKELESAISLIESSIESVKNTVQNADSSIASIQSKLTSAGI